MAERGIFSGLKVIDAASFIAAPAAATILADFGADVIKVEPTGAGDAYRNTSFQPGMPVADTNYCWTVDGRNKRSLALDLKRPEAQRILHRLIAEADVFITNYPPPARRRLGIAYAQVSHINARLIYASLTAYGEAGAEADKPGFDSTGWWARSGMMDQVRPDAHSLPARSIPGMGDHPTALALYGAIVTALFRRARLRNARALTARLDELFLGRDAEEWMRLLEAKGFIVALVARASEALNDRQMHDNGAIVPLRGGGYTVSSPLWIDGAEKAPAAPAPGLGQHSDAILREHGVSPEEIARLRADGVIG